MAPAPNRFHQDISLNLERILDRYLAAHPIGRIYHAPFDVYLSQTDVYQPDVIFISKSNYWILSDAGAEGSPDLVIEILSEPTAQLDRKPKKQIYARYGVKELWIVNPDSRTIEIYHLQKDTRQPVAVHDAKAVFGSATFPGLKLSAAKIFKR